jgi:hypothetical protein
MSQSGGSRPVRLGAPDTNIADPQRRGTSDFNFPIKPHPFYKGWIVADNEEGAVKGSQRLLEKLDRIESHTRFKMYAI